MYDEVEIEDMEWNDGLQAFTFACPCGDVFQITKVRVSEGGRARARGGAPLRALGWGQRGGRRPPTPLPGLPAICGGLST